MSRDTRVRVYEAAKQYIEEHGYPPSTIELADILGLSSPSTVNHHLQRLEEEGKIQRTKGVARSIVIKE